METIRPAVLIVDDDRGTCETVDWVLRPVGFRVAMAASGAEGLALARSARFELLLIDLCLPDMLGTEMIRALADGRPPVPFVLVSGFLTTDITVEAMKLGAANVIQKPMTIEALRETVDAVITPCEGRLPPEGGSHRKESDCPVSVAMDALRPRSAAERWAVHVLKGCEADGDVKTMQLWAACSGVSVSSLAESSEILGIHPRDARDFTRLLRALIKSIQYDCAPEALLDVSDRRTLRTLLERGGLAHRIGRDRVPVDQFLDRQRLVCGGNDGLRVLRALLTRRSGNARDSES